MVTGASQGIGRATAVALARTGRYSKVVMVARNAEKLEETRRMLPNPEMGVVVPFDLTDLEGIPSMVSVTCEEYGPLELLVNVSGYTDPKPIVEMSADSLRRTYEVNVFAVAMMCKEAVRQMRPRHSGKIVNIGSTAGSTARPGWLSYASSKASVISMSKTLTAELAEYGIKVYCVSPGRCATDLRRKLAPEEDPMTIMQPEDVAEVICSLAGKTGNALDGQDVVVRQQPRI